MCYVLACHHITGCCSGNAGAGRVECRAYHSARWAGEAIGREHSGKLWCRL